MGYGLSPEVAASRCSSPLIVKYMPRLWLPFQLIAWLTCPRFRTNTDAQLYQSLVVVQTKILYIRLIATYYATTDGSWERRPAHNHKLSYRELRGSLWLSGLKTSPGRLSDMQFPFEILSGSGPSHQFHLSACGRDPCACARSHPINSYLCTYSTLAYYINNHHMCWIRKREIRALRNQKI